MGPVLGFRQRVTSLSPPTPPSVLGIKRGPKPHTEGKPCLFVVEPNLLGYLRCAAHRI